MATLGPIHGNSNGCAACGEQFGALAQFDAHQDVDYERDRAVICRPPAGLGLVQDDRGVWQTPEGLARREMDRARLAGMASSRPRARAQSAAQDVPVSQ
jgi:hypothetical protein